MKIKPMDHKDRINPVYKAFFLPVILIDNIIFSQKDLIDKLLSLIFPVILLFIWSIAWTALVMLIFSLFGINFHIIGEFASLVTIIWAAFFIVIPIVLKQKKLNIIYGSILVLVFLFFVNMFILRTPVVNGHSMEPSIKDGARIYVYRFSDYKVNDIVIYEDPANSVQYIGRIISLPKHIYSSDEPSGYTIQTDNKDNPPKTVSEKNITGRVINFK
ncbi:MAG: signal peptidase I [bacterium]